MNRLRWTGIVFIVVGLFLLLACKFGRDKPPSINVSPARIEPGAVITVSGKGWRPGEQVLIGLNAPNAPPEDSETVTTALTDASGDFVALFSFPEDGPWASMTELCMVAHTRDFSKVAVASLNCTELSTATPVPSSTVSAIPSVEPATYVLGYVEDISASARTITVKPIEGQAEVIALVESTEIICDGRLAQLMDIQIGDLIEAHGQVGANNSMIADRIYILARVTVEATATPTATTPVLAWRGEYYNNTTFSGNPSVVREDPIIDFQWQDGAAAEGLAVDNFAVRWTGSWPFETGAYRFYAQVDDGVRLWLDEHVIVDHWHESTSALYSADAYLSAGLHAVKAEYFDAHGDAHARLWWEYRGLDAAQEYPHWRGEYYSNMTLSGTPFLVVNERVIDFDWGTGVPASGMPDSEFSVRWTRTVKLEEGVYRFYTHVDDGVRLWVDETELIDQWHDAAWQTYFGDVDLSSGNHDIRVEYYEHAGHAVIRVWWEVLPSTPTPTSTATHGPTHTPLPLTPTPTLTTTPEFNPPLSPDSVWHCLIPVCIRSGARGCWRQRLILDLP